MPADDDLPRQMGGRYRLDATLGHGGMGVVYRGVDLTAKRPVAVKLVRALDGDLEDEVAGRFLREARNTARLRHPNIVEVFDHGRTDDGGMYLAMELLEGESLAARLKRESALSPATTVHIVRQICEALAVAHDAGVVHRDLKPANIMLLARGAYPDFVKVLDFGVAKSFESEDATQLTHTGMLVGTVDYMAPEQIMGKAVDGRTDIYALGILLYRLLAGKAPFKDNGVPALIHAHLNTLPKPLIEVAKGVPNDLDHVVLRCLAKKAERRYESMPELARALLAAVPAASAIGRTAGDDPYDDGELTLLAPGRAPPPPPSRPPPQPRRVSPDDETMLDSSQSVAFEDETIKIDRPIDVRKPISTGASALPMTPRGASMRSSRSPAPRREVNIAYSDDGSTAKTVAPVVEAPQPGARVCAVCQTMNVAHARACSACGVALVTERTAAARTRGATPRTASQSAPYMPPPSSGPYPNMPPAGVGLNPSLSGAPSSGPPPSGAPPLSGAPQASGPYGTQSSQGVPAMPPQMTWPPPPEPPRSIWDRFLRWTGFRSR